MNMKLARDSNGNSILKITGINNLRGFSIQTNGNLNKTHCLGIGSWTEGEVYAYVKEFGTQSQKDKFGL